MKFEITIDGVELTMVAKRGDRTVGESTHNMSTCSDTREYAGKHINMFMREHTIRTCQNCANFMPVAGITACIHHRCEIKPVDTCSDYKDRGLTDEEKADFGSLFNEDNKNGELS